MAEDKKSFLLYCDLIHTVDKLPDEIAGKLFKHVLNYVNDKNPEPEDILLQIAFEPIKQQLKRDLEKWEGKTSQRSDAGKKSAAKKQFEKFLLDNPQIYNISKDEHLFEMGRCVKKQNESYNNGYTTEWFYFDFCIKFHNERSTKSTSVNSRATKSTVSDTVTDTVNVNVNGTVKEKPITKPNKGETSSLHLILKRHFLEKYKSDFGIEFYWTAKEAGNLTGLIKKIKFSLKNNGKLEDDQGVTDVFLILINNLPDFYQSKMSISIINSKYNEIIADLKSKQTKGDKRDQAFSNWAKNLS